MVEKIFLGFWLLLKEVFYQGSLKLDRGNRVYPDIIFCPFDSQKTCKCNNAAFAGGIIRIAGGKTNNTGNRSHINDASTLASCDHMLAHFLVEQPDSL